jgi:hypothetical protein
MSLLNDFFKSMGQGGFFDEYVKVCEICESLVLDKFFICPYCKSYRFTYNIKAIKKGINKLKKKIKDSQIN